MSALAIPTDSLRLDADGRIGTDLPCVGCRYNLRGLSPSGRCPECGRLVAYATRALELGRRDPAFLRRIAAGVRWLIAGASCVLITAGCAVLWIRFESWRTLIDRFAVPLFAVGVVTLLLGFLAVTTPHLLERQGKRRLSRRRLARVATTIGILMLPLGISMSDRLTYPLDIYYGFICTALLGAGAWAALAYGALIASENGHRGMALQSRLLGGLIVVGMLTLITLGVSELLPFPLRSWPARILGAMWIHHLFWVGTLGIVLLTAWSVSLLVWYHGHLLEAARTGEAEVPVAG